MSRRFNKIQVSSVNPELISPEARGERGGRGGGGAVRARRRRLDAEFVICVARFGSDIFPGKIRVAFPAPPPAPPRPLLGQAAQVKRRCSMLGCVTLRYSAREREHRACRISICSCEMFSQGSRPFSRQIRYREHCRRAAPMAETLPPCNPAAPLYLSTPVATLTSRLSARKNAFSRSARVS